MCEKYDILYECISACLLSFDQSLFVCVCVCMRVYVHACYMLSQEICLEI